MHYAAGMQWRLSEVARDAEHARANSVEAMDSVALLCEGISTAALAPPLDQLPSARRGDNSAYFASTLRMTRRSSAAGSAATLKLRQAT